MTKQDVGCSNKHLCPLRGSRLALLHAQWGRGANVQLGDEIIIASSVYCQIDEAIEMKPKVLVFDQDNEIINRITYDLFRRPDGSLDMTIKSSADGIESDW
ncbi:hypothetical protein [Phyllobacterium sophorae]|uniref:hypothetical protein n=1 Tax=Phyllobacterium sophorae TaxID=1520277 RepID=UPI003CCA3F37